MRLLDRIFVDSGAWIAYLNKDDPENRKAVETMEEIERSPFKLYTSSFVVAETATFLAYHHSPEIADKFGEFIRSLIDTNTLDIFYIGASTMFEGFDCMKAHRNIKLSLADATSYVLVKSEKIDRIFAFDNDFRKLGLACIPQ